MLDFRRLQFGFSDAETEAAEAPELLLGGYFDAEGWSSKIRDGRHVLVLGPKGSGKTALAEHVRLSSSASRSTTTMTLSMKSFPFRQFRQISNQGSDDLSKIDDVWTWLLSLVLFELLGRDPNLAAPKEFYQARSQLQKANVIASEDIPHLVERAGRSTFRLSIAGVIGYETDSAERDVSYGPYFGPFVRRFKQVVLETTPSVPSILFIDGLDDVELSDPEHLKVLGGLIDAAAEFTRAFRARGVQVKIVVLCRTDVFELIQSSNKTKVRNDLGIELSWYDNVREPANSRLFRLADTKARVTGPEVTSVVRQFFPATYVRRNMAAYLADRTRHLPRDILRLLSFIQEASGENATPNSIGEGLRNYSQRYLLGEIKDAMVGFVDSDDVELGFATIGSIGRTEFGIEDVEKSVHATAPRLDGLERFLSRLFEAGGLGLVDKSGPNSASYTFKYRTPTQSLDHTKVLRVHPGLWPALNLRANSGYRSGSG